MTVTSPWSYLEVHQNLAGLASQGRLRYKELYHLEWKKKKSGIHIIDSPMQCESQWQLDQDTSSYSICGIQRKRRLSSLIRSLELSLVWISRRSVLKSELQLSDSNRQKGNKKNIDSKKYQFNNLQKIMDV